jgi:hypothetical protein
MKQLTSTALLATCFETEYGGDMSSETSVDFQHDVISQKIDLFITTDVRTSNPTIRVMLETELHGPQNGRSFGCQW